jgi:hypothetical protein
MLSWQALDPVVLKPDGDISVAFIESGNLNYQAAARYVCRLPYGRNSLVRDPLVVMREGRGTCSTKHALLRSLAMEQDLEIALVIGIYEMSEKNTPGVGHVLDRYQIASLPEAHCYLRVHGTRIDVTRENCGPQELIARFLHEEDIAPDQIGDYKTVLHRQFLQRWIAQSGASGGRSVDEIWRIREECMAALTNRTELVGRTTSA